MLRPCRRPWLLALALALVPRPLVAAGRGFAFGIEYGVPGLARAYARTGAHTVKPTPELLMWKRIQASPRARYDWSLPDRHIREYQLEGFDRMQLLISAESPWGSRGAWLLARDTRPKPEYEEEYQRFVQAAVERYDGDGEDDMPGLRYPILEWGVEREFTGYFPGNGAQYVELLKLARPAIKAACPEAKVLLVALLMWDLFQGNPGPGELKERFRNPPGGKRKDLRDIPVLLDAHPYFDVVDIHCLSDETEIVPAVAFVRRELERRGTRKEIYIGDAFPASPLLAYGFETCEPGMLKAKEFHPVDRSSRCVAAKVIADLRHPGTARGQEAHRWLEAFHAASVVRKLVVAAASGAHGINIGNLEDWPIPAGAGTCQFMGLMDVDRTLGDQLKVIRTPREPRPGFHALTLTIKALDGFERVSPVAHPDPRVRAYLFTVKGAPRLVAWLDDGTFHPPGEPLPSLKTVLPFPAGTASVIWTPTRRGEQPEPRSVPVSPAGVRVELTPEPVFLISH